MHAPRMYVDHEPTRYRVTDLYLFVPYRNLSFILENIHCYLMLYVHIFHKSYFCINLFLRNGPQMPSGDQGITWRKPPHARFLHHLLLPASEIVETTVLPSIDSAHENRPLAPPRVTMAVWVIEKIFSGSYGIYYPNFVLLFIFMLRGVFEVDL